MAAGLFFLATTSRVQTQDTDYLYFSNDVAYDSVSSNWYVDAIYERDIYTWVLLPSDEWGGAFYNGWDNGNLGDLLEGGDNFTIYQDRDGNMEFAQDTYTGDWYAWNPSDWDDVWGVAGGWDSIGGPFTYDNWEYFYALDGLDPTAPGAITLCYAFDPVISAWYQGSGDTDPSTWESCPAPGLTDFAFSIGTYQQYFGWTYHIINGVYYANQTGTGNWYWYSGSALTLESAWYLFSLGNNPEFTQWQACADPTQSSTTEVSDPTLNLAGDGIPDWWKALNGLNPFAGLAAAQDFGDGHTDLAEYQLALAEYNAAVSGDLVGNLTNFETVYTADSESYPDSTGTDSGSGDQPNLVEYGASGFDFPRTAVSPYALTDLGAGTFIDMNDEGDVLMQTGTYHNEDLDFYADIDTLWYGGTAYYPPSTWADNDNIPITWTSLAADGTVLGYAWIVEYGTLCPVSWDGTSVSSPDSYYFSAPSTFLQQINTRAGDIYFQSVDWDGSTAIYLWSAADGSVTQVSDIYAADSSQYGNTVSVTDGHDPFTLATTVWGDELDYQVSQIAYWGNGGEAVFEGQALLNGVPVSDGVAQSLEFSYGTLAPEDILGTFYYGSQNAFVANPDPDYPETLDVLNGTAILPVNLTANASSSTPLTLRQISSMGQAVTVDGQLVLNGQVPALTSILPAGAFNDNLSLNLTGLHINATYASPAVQFRHAASNGLVGGQVVNSANTSAMPHVFIGIPMENPFIIPPLQLLGFTFQFNTPRVLPVNSNFDEQKLDENGYAQPDYIDEDLTCASGPNAGKLMVNDLMKGFFGINPNTMPPWFYNGANVTIQKLPNIDPETETTPGNSSTGQVESGDVRLYAVQYRGIIRGEQEWSEWVIPTNVTDDDGNVLTNDDGTPVLNNLVPSLYLDEGDGAYIPHGSDVKYYIEGIAPGPCTLQFTYTSAGGQTFTQTQKFLVCTQKSKAQWQADIQQEILLETGVNMGNYTEPASTAFTTSPFLQDMIYVQKVYDYYQTLSLHDNTVLIYPGLARMAAGPVYGGLNDTERARIANDLFGLLFSGLAADVIDGELDKIQIGILEGNYQIFEDLGWQLRAYQASGIWALRFVDTQKLDGRDAGSLKIDLQNWNNLYQGYYSPNPALIKSANELIIKREQFSLLKDGYARISAVPGAATICSTLAKSPLYPYGDDFSEVMEAAGREPGDITQFSDRWFWIDTPLIRNTGKKGIYYYWLPFSQGARDMLDAQPIEATAQFYSISWPHLPILMSP